jgi:hypothetical protein
MPCAFTPTAARAAFATATKVYVRLTSDIAKTEPNRSRAVDPIVFSSLKEVDTVHLAALAQTCLLMRASFYDHVELTRLV